jgi:thioredoxin reductase
MVMDAIVVGGSYAGLAAALQLARARRDVLVIDGGKRRNRFASHSHGFLTRDGEAAAAIAAIGREQLLAYPTARWLDGEVIAVERIGEGFSVAVAGAEKLAAKRLVLATGVSDDLPAIPGLAERWGKSVFHCPYCHGYELNRGRVGVLATSPLSMHLALLLPDWGETTFLLNGAFTPDAAQRAQLAARGAAIEPTPIAALRGAAEIVLEDGHTLPLDGLFVAAPFVPASPLAERLGCVMDEGPLGRVVRTEMTKATSVAGVFACGDAARMRGSVALAVGDGTIAGAAAHQSLIFEMH